jgi:hypothetical protein
MFLSYPQWPPCVIRHTMSILCLSCPTMTTVSIKRDSFPFPTNFLLPLKTQQALLAGSNRAVILQSQDVKGGKEGQSGFWRAPCRPFGGRWLRALQLCSLFLSRSLHRHVFHKLCVDPWLNEHCTCPMCKLNILKALGIMVSISVVNVLVPYQWKCVKVSMPVPVWPQPFFSPLAWSHDTLDPNNERKKMTLEDIM